MRASYQDRQAGAFGSSWYWRRRWIRCAMGSAGCSTTSVVNIAYAHPRSMSKGHSAHGTEGSTCLVCRLNGVALQVLAHLLGLDGVHVCVVLCCVVGNKQMHSNGAHSAAYSSALMMGARARMAACS
jgi:hypothetical protein